MLYCDLTEIFYCIQSSFEFYHLSRKIYVQINIYIYTYRYIYILVKFGIFGGSVR